MRKSQMLTVAAIALLITAYFAFDLGSYLSLDYFKSQHTEIEAYYSANPVTTAALFFIIYVVVTGLSLPGAAIMTLVAGAIFGLSVGTLIVSFASTLGATIAFLASRYLFREAIQRQFGDKLKTINDGIEKDGAFYLFTLRLVPAFPFFVINLLMGLTPI
ncbi:MAG TPA: TVP38/TMEM64 family protein, partial [Chromatiales bacterium]|nr:TVP38/TMEM64 family protein [Chromatiales bacterium]